MNARRPSALAPAALLGLALAACHPSDVDPMKAQQKQKAYRANDFFDDGRGMRTPPAGTVAREAIIDPALRDGELNGQPLATIPLPVDLALLTLGRKRYDISCAVCHGVLGDGKSVMADKFSLRLPPSLLDARLRGRPPGNLFKVVTQGYGVMPSYAAEIPVRERWAVVAYLKALQRSAETTLADAPPEARRELEAAP